MDRAYFLTAQLESPTYGSVQSYDGAGLSAGPLHHVAVYPRNLGQGSLFELLGRMELGQAPTPSMLALISAYRTRGWAVTAAGTLVDVKTGKPVPGKTIVEEFAPNGNVVPKQGPFWERAKRWAYLHHVVFSDPVYFATQKAFAIDWLVSGQKTTEDIFYKKKNVRTLEVEKDLTPAEDLALCVYHAFSANAPGPAQEILYATLQEKRGPKEFPKALIERFSRSSYGNWKTRYTRTRTAAVNSGLWPLSLFAGRGTIYPLRNALVGES
jgi:hypothetical protein